MYQNKKIGVIIAAAGSGTRMGGGISKQFRKIENIPVLTRAVSAFDIHPFIDEILVVTREDSLDFCREEMIAPFGFAKVCGVVPGGEARQDSVYRGLLALTPGVEYVLVHDGARPFISQKVISDTVAAVIRREAVVVAVPVKDTIKAVSLGGETDSDGEGFFTCTPDRSTLYAVQTPQAFYVPLLREGLEKAFAEKFYGTDDSVLVERLNKKVYLVKGEYENLKITTAGDMETGTAVLRYTALRDAEKVKPKEEPSYDFMRGKSDKWAAEGMPVKNTLPMVRMGTGFDVHRLAVDRKLILGGVEIPWEKGLLGHSDADVLIHAVIDALLGAAALGDIGKHFPDRDEAYRGASSLALLERVEELLRREGHGVGNVDAVVIAEQPKIAPFIPAMREKIAQVLKISEGRVGIKATTTEGLGYCGRGEGIASQAVAVIYSLEEK